MNVYNVKTCRDKIKVFFYKKNLDEENHQDLQKTINLKRNSLFFKIIRNNQIFSTMSPRIESFSGFYTFFTGCNHIH